MFQVMFTRCLICSTPFPPNETLERFPRGERVAYDPDRGRLWAVCTRCRRWTLAPMIERWEALEELERLVTDRARLLSRTDHIALFRVGSLEIVRVGEADRTEQAWWRYGRVLMERRRSFRRISTAGSVAVGAAVLGGWVTGGLSGLAAWLLWENAPRGGITDLTRWLRFGSAAWRGRKTCPGCGHILREIRYSDRKVLTLRPTDEGGPPGLSRRCPRCGDVDRGGLHLTGDEAERALRRVLAYHHYSGASEERVRTAARLVEGAGHPRRLPGILARHGRVLGDLPRTALIALEIAANEEAERRWLELEVSELEARWHVEEELASIVDGELTPMPLLETIRRKVAGIDAGTGDG